MANQPDILGDYIKMREGINLREQADLDLIKLLKEENETEHALRLKAEARVAELEKQIELLQSTTSITNNYINHDYIAKQVVGL